MSAHPQHLVRTIALPSGRTLEVVQPDHGDPYTRVKPSEVEDRDLCHCDACGSALVEPVSWDAAGPQQWRVELRCPNCQLWTEGVFSQECVDRFDEALDAGTTAVVKDLKRLEHSNMVDAAERFIGALHAGAITPEDF